MSYSNQETLEDAIVTKIASLFTDGKVDVEAMADNEAEFKKTFAKPRISVLYHSSKGGNNLSIDGNVQESSGSVQVMYEARNRRGERGIFHLHKIVEDNIGGFAAPNWTPVTIGPFEYSSRSEGGVWVYNLVLRTEMVNHQVVENYNGVDLTL